MAATVPDAADLLDEAPCGLLVTGLDGMILKVNSTFCGWVGVARDELVLKRRLQDLFTMGGRIFHQTHWVPTLQMQGSLAEVKFDVVHHDGRSIPMILNARRRKRPSGEFDEIAAFVAQDRNRYERELMNARKKADSLLEVEREAQRFFRDRALFAEQMVGIVSHDLRNPLSAILTGVRLLGRGENERRIRIMDHVRGSAERAQRLIEELLDFTQARVGAGLAVHLQPINLHELVASTVDELRLAFPGRVIDHRAEGPGTCIADGDRLAQLLGNLVGNAATYGHSGAAITVSSNIEQETAELSVHNEGEPIAAAALSTIFEPMVRGHTASSSVRSVGLGLFIVREIAKSHHGEMKVESSAEQGTTFTLIFPSNVAGTPTV